MKKTSVSRDVLAALSAASFEGKEMRLSNQLDRGLYAKVKKVVESAGGKWERKAAAHVFEGDAAEAIEPILLTGEIIRPADMGQFDSPPEVVARVIALADIEEGHFVLEPSAGVGNIAKAVIAAGAVVRAVEIDAKRVEKLKAEGIATRCMDFLTLDPDMTMTPGGNPLRFDRVVMNPPFAKQADIDHVTHAMRWLKPGGRLVSVMAAGVMFRQNRKTTDFVERMTDMGAEWEDLPEKAFKMAGTAVGTVILAVNAPE